jgi:HEAT repeat protein
MRIVRTLSLLAIIVGMQLGSGGARADDAGTTADEATLRAAGLQTDGPALLEFFRKQTLSEADQARLAATVRQLGASSYRAREKASDDLEKAGRSAIYFLRAALDDPDPEIARRAQACLHSIESAAFVNLTGAAARLVSVRRPKGAVAVLLNYLPFADDDIIEEELHGTLSAVGVRDGKIDPLLTAALQDRTVLRRAAAARLVGRLGDETERAAVRRLLKDADAKVRLGAAQGLFAVNDAAAVPTLVALTGEASPAVARQAEDLLYRLAGDQAPPVAAGSVDAAERRKCQEAWAAWWRENDSRTLLEFFRKQTPSEGDKIRLANLVRQLGASTFRAREQASADLGAAGRSALPFLRAAVKDPDVEIARRANQCLQDIQSRAFVARARTMARLLAVRQPDDAVAVLLNYLPFADDEALEEELLATLGVVGVHDGKVDPLLTAALQDKTPVRRAAAARAVGQFGDADQRQAVAGLLADSDVRVRLQAAQGLIAARDKRGVPGLIGLLYKDPPAVAWQAEDLLYRIAGDQAPLTSGEPSNTGERQKRQEAWTTWWREHEVKVDLAKLDLEQRLLGLTLIVAYDGFPTGGRIWESGADGKVRWMIDKDLSGPIDAHILPGNRILIAEHQANRVTERNFKGEILWQHRVTTSPVSCQRLPNGNTFIGTYNEVLEVTRDNKVLYTYPCSKGSSFCAQKLRNGHIIYVTMNGGVVVELDGKGKEARTINVGQAAGWATVEQLPGGGFLVAQGNSAKVVEFDAAGKKVWECASVPSPNGATRLPNGNTLVCSNNEKHVMEVNRAGKVVWKQNLEGRPFRIRRR